MRFDSLLNQLERIFSFDFLSFSDEDSQKSLLRYNSILQQTLSIYKNIESCLRACSVYAETLFRGQYLQAMSLAQNVSQALYPPVQALSNPAIAETNKNETVMISYLAQLLQVAKATANVEPKQPVTLIVQASGREMSRVVIDDINTLSRMTGGDVLR